MITQCLYTLDYHGQQFGTNVQNGVVSEAKTLSTDVIHSGKELCRHIAKPLTMMRTQLPHQTVFIQLKMMERGMAINPLKTTCFCLIVS